MAVRADPQRCGRCRRRVEAAAGLVGQPGGPLGCKHRRLGSQQVWRVTGRHHGAVDYQRAPGERGAAHGHDRDDVDGQIEKVRDAVACIPCRRSGRWVLCVDEKAKPS
jgi:hypothetical protein